jgi:hypothetical protein
MSEPQTPRVMIDAMPEPELVEVARGRARQGARPARARAPGRSSASTRNSSTSCTATDDPLDRADVERGRARGGHPGAGIHGAQALGGQAPRGDRPAARRGGRAAAHGVSLWREVIDRGTEQHTSSASTEPAGSDEPLPVIVVPRHLPMTDATEDDWSAAAGARRDAL